MEIGFRHSETCIIVLWWINEQLVFNIAAVNQSLVTCALNLRKRIVNIYICDLSCGDPVQLVGHQNPRTNSCFVHSVLVQIKTYTFRPHSSALCTTPSDCLVCFSVPITLLPPTPHYRLGCLSLFSLKLGVWGRGGGGAARQHRLCQTKTLIMLLHFSVKFMST